MAKSLTIKHKHNYGRVRRAKPNRETQELLLRLQENRCFYCGLVFDDWYHDGEFARRRTICWDHVSPYSLTFNNEPDNFVASCARCNGIKASKVFDTFEEAATFVRTRLRKKGYPMSIQWGTKRIKKLVTNKVLAQVSSEVFELPNSDASQEEIEQKLMQIREFQTLLKSLPEPKALRGSRTFTQYKQWLAP